MSLKNHFEASIIVCVNTISRLFGVKKSKEKYIYIRLPPPPSGRSQTGYIRLFLFSKKKEIHTFILYSKKLEKINKGPHCISHIV